MINENTCVVLAVWLESGAGRKSSERERSGEPRSQKAMERERSWNGAESNGVESGVLEIP